MVLKPRHPAPRWDGFGKREQAAKCQSTAAPTRADDPFFDDEEEAIQLCNGDYDGVVCPLRHECLIFALKNNEAYGVWGGMFEHDRKVLRRRLRDDEDEDMTWEVVQWHAPTVPEGDDEPEEDLDEADDEAFLQAA